MSNINEIQVKVGKHEINHVDIGSGQTIIFLHNGGGFWQIWQKQIEYFSQSYRVIAIDWPGFGESSQVNELISLELLTQTLKEFIELKSLQNIILIGNCIGASAALNYANMYPKKIDKLILFNICPGELLFKNQISKSLFKNIHKNLFLNNFLGSLFPFLFTKTRLKNNFPKILFGKELPNDDFLIQKYNNKFKEIRQTDSRLNLLFSVFTFTLKQTNNGSSHFENYLIWGENNKVTTIKDHFEHHFKILQPKKKYIIESGGHLCMYDEAEKTNLVITEIINN